MSGSVILSLAIGRVEPVVIALPFLLVLAASMIVGRTRPDIDVRLSTDRTKVLEGDVVEVVVEAAIRMGSSEVGFLIDLPAGFELIDPPRVARVTVSALTTMRARIRCDRWGAHSFGGGMIQARDPLSAFVHEQLIEPTLELRVYPRPERLRSLLRPHALRPRFGSLVSRASGTGLEFADIREFAPGDQQRHINWKATARHRQLHVNLFHPERSADVVLLLDTFIDVAGDNVSSLELAVRGATSVAMECLKRRDRVGLLTIGGTMQWLLPGMGMRQLYRIVDSLMQTRLAFSYAWPNVEAIPKRVLPPAALVIALTPMADRRTPAILLDLYSRGHDVAVVEISADAVLLPPTKDREQLAHRLWSLHREAIRHQYLQMGLPVSPWRPGEPLQIPLMELHRFRSTSRRLRA
ncbi:MAG TPA: DUF58 domain-containing protein [Candidatus Dormibacteraeota bacterium]